MAAFFIYTLCFILFHPQFLLAGPISSFSFQRFDKVSNFNSQFALYGDAGPVSNGSALQFTNSVSSSAGRVMYKNPIKLAQGNNNKNNNNHVNLASFSTFFSFSMSPESGDGLAFVMVSGGFNVSAFEIKNPFGLSLRSEKSGSEIVAVEFDTKLDVKYGDLNANHVGINVGGFESVEAINASSANVLLNNGKRLNAWIDYEASSKRLEVRLSRFGDLKPISPLLSYPIDLSKLWKDEKVYLGLSSSNGNSSQTCLVYSWSFLLRGVPHWMHSHPLDPQTFGKNAKPPVVVGGVHKRSTCVLRVLAAMIFGTACGALGAFMVLYLWTIFGNRRPVVPEECSSVHPVDFEYKKFKVVVEKAVEDGKQ